MIASLTQLSQELQHFLTNKDFMNDYLIFIIIAIALVCLFLLFILFSGKEEPVSSTNTKKPTPQKPHIITSHDIKAIAGGNVMTTQLDLARAYIEMGKKQLAKKILTHVIEHGDENHQNEANALITTL